MENFPGHQIGENEQLLITFVCVVWLHVDDSTRENVAKFLPARLLNPSRFVTAAKKVLLEREILRRENLLLEKAGILNEYIIFFQVDKVWIVDTLRFHLAEDSSRLFQVAVNCTQTLLHEQDEYNEPGSCDAVT